MWISKTNILRYEVSVGDINYGGHMGNDRSLLVFHDARIKFLKSLNASEKNIGDQVGIIMTEAHVYFKKEVFMHDVLLVDVAISDITTSSINFDFNVHRENDNTTVLTGSTKIIAYDYDKRRITRIPQSFIDNIKIR